MNEFFHIMGLPLAACLILTGIHAYLGLHVIERQVIFVDLALAQIAVLGSGFALLFGYNMDTAQSYWLSLGFTVLGAFLFSLFRFKKQRIPQEALIGISYAVSSALLIIVLSRSGEGDEHIRQALAGNVLLVSPQEVLKVALIYALIGIVHYVCRRPFFMITQGHDGKSSKPESFNLRWWDFLFYVSFGIVVTSSVRIVGVLLVFSFLIIPAACAVIFSENIRTRLILGWGVGFLASLSGMIISYSFDLPSAASVVCMLAVILIVLSIAKIFLKTK